jgi:hypothetical protein
MNIEGIHRLGFYLIHNNGIILNLRTFKIYNNINNIITIANSRKKIDRLIASLFIENKNDLPYVKHIDGDILNNNVNNLLWSNEIERKKINTKSKNRNIYDITITQSTKSDIVLNTYYGFVEIQNIILQDMKMDINKFMYILFEKDYFLFNNFRWKLNIKQYQMQTDYRSIAFIHKNDFIKSNYLISYDNSHIYNCTNNTILKIYINSDKQRFSYITDINEKKVLYHYNIDYNKIQTQSIITCENFDNYTIDLLFDNFESIDMEIINKLTNIADVFLKEEKKNLNIYTYKPVNICYKLTY